MLVFRRLCAVLIVIASGGLIYWSFWGHGVPHKVVNLCSLAGLVVVSVLNGPGSGQQRADRFRRLYLLSLPCVLLPYLITIHAPLLYDAYSHVVTASRETWGQAVSTFYVHPTSGDFFFRPIGYLDYKAEVMWAGFSFLRWQAGGLALHCAACMAMYLLGREAGFSGQGSLVAALFFGVHGANPEVVSWTGARFDELGTLFAIGALVLLLRYTRGETYAYPGMMMAALLALGSKESAFCLPLLAACVVAMKPMPRFE